MAAELHNMNADEVSKAKSEEQLNTAKANFWSSMACLVDEVTTLVTSFRIILENKAARK